MPSSDFQLKRSSLSDRWGREERRVEERRGEERRGEERRGEERRGEERRGEERRGEERRGEERRGEERRGEERRGEEVNVIALLSWTWSAQDSRKSETQTSMFQRKQVL